MYVYNNTLHLLINQTPHQSIEKPVLIQTFPHDEQIVSHPLVIMSEDGYIKTAHFKMQNMRTEPSDAITMTVCGV